MTITISISTVFVILLLCWSSPVLGNNNNNMLSDRDIKEFELAFAKANALAPAPAPTPANHSNNIPLPFPCRTGGACRDVAEKYGYKCEEHSVVTRDGYILSMQRIPSTKNASNSSTPAPPVLLQHGLFMDGVGWMLLEKDSLAFYLADMGFDVWINNNRGTTYSPCHKWFNILEPGFWDFSWQEFSEIDLDATISYVYNNTQQKVHYVGHSMGTHVVLAALAVHQPTIKMMRSVALLAPIGHLDFMTSVFGRVGAELFMAELRDLVQLHEFNPLGRMSSLFCAKVCDMFHIDCSFGLWAATGPNCCIDGDSFERFLQHEPQSTSTKVLMHFSQSIRGGGFAKYDYGLLGNMFRYKQATPPLYVMKDIPTDFPIFLGYGALDSLADILDVLKLINDLESHDKDKLVTNFQLFYAHMDYQLAHVVLQDVYQPIVSFFNSN